MKINLAIFALKFTYAERSWRESQLTSTLTPKTAGKRSSSHENGGNR